VNRSNRPVRSKTYHVGLSPFHVLGRRRPRDVRYSHRRRRSPFLLCPRVGLNPNEAPPVSSAPPTPRRTPTRRSLPSLPPRDRPRVPSPVFRLIPGGGSRMALRGVWQLQKLVVNYCDWGGSSRGIRYDIIWFLTPVVVVPLDHGVSVVFHVLLRN